MDAIQFDALTRSLGTAGSRRRALGGLLGGALGLVGWRGGEEAAAHNPLKKCKKIKDKAKRKKCLKKAKAHNAQHAAEATVPPPQCTPTCAPTNPCGPDGCSGSCGLCTGGSSCIAGTCTCPGGQELCGGACIPVCGPGEARNPHTCGCCLAHGQQCSWENNLCCSGECEYNASTARHECSALDEGEAGCTFDAQCASGNCIYDPVIDFGFCGA